MSITLNAIYRYPIKGFTGQRLSEVAVTEGKPLPWDRAFAIENGPSDFDPNAPDHLPKIHFLMLMRQPELATLQTDFDPQSGILTVHHDFQKIAEGNLFEPDSMSKVLQIMAAHCKKPLRGEPKLLHAKDHAFTDSRTQDLSLINLASVRDLSSKVGEELNPIRFRGNLYIEGADPWQEHDWVGKVVELDGIAFKVRKRTERCAATNANPRSGERDQNIPKALMDHYDHTDCGIHMMPLSGGMLKTGAKLSVKDS